VTNRLSRASSPAAIEDDLALLWRDAAHDGPVARALMANLVVYRDRPATEDVDLDAPIEGVPVDDVAERHPSRLIVLHHGGRTGASAPIGASISILLFGPPNARFGVEEIAVRSTCAEASLPSIVRRLSLGDIPTSIWWTEDLSRATPLDALVTMGRQLVYDSRQWSDVSRGVLALAPVIARERGPDLADLNWRRLTPMRVALTHALAPPLGHIDAAGVRVRIGHRPGDAALAWLLAGWFCARLGWPDAAELPATIEEDVSGRGGPGDSEGDVVLRVAVSASGGTEITASMNEHRVLVEYGSSVAPFSIAAPEETEADAVAAELRTLTYDADLREAIAALARRFTSSK
jgi:glucose-6-phosphate dehydrogenase assembly protein OpcA